MKKFISTTFLVCAFAVAFAQPRTGVNTQNPQTTFHVDGAKDNAATGVPTAAQQANDFVVTSTGAVGVGTSNPHPSAALEINSSNKGFVIPTTRLTSAADATTIPNPPTGLLVFHDGTAPLDAGIYSNVGTPASPNWKDRKFILPPEAPRFFKMLYTGTTENLTKELDAGKFHWRVVNGGTRTEQIPGVTAASTTHNLLRIEAKLKSLPSNDVHLRGGAYIYSPKYINQTGHRYANTVSTTWGVLDYGTWKEVVSIPTEYVGMLFLSTDDDDLLNYEISTYLKKDDFTAIVVETL